MHHTNYDTGRVSSVRTHLLDHVSLLHVLNPGGVSHFYELSCVEKYYSVVQSMTCVVCEAIRRCGVGVGFRNPHCVHLTLWTHIYLASMPINNRGFTNTLSGSQILQGAGQPLNETLLLWSSPHR